MENKTFFVYLYKNPLKNNEIFYVGYGDHLRKGGGCRAYDHLNEVKRGIISKNLHKYYTIKKILDGGSSPMIEIILNNVTKKEATDLEKELRIKHKDTLTNIANGGDGGDTFTNQPLWKKDIIRKKLKNKVPTIHSEEWKSQLSEMRKKDGNPFYGKKHTDTTKEKCGSVWRGKKIPEDLINKRRTLSIYKLEFPDGTDLTFTGRVEYENFFRNYNNKKSKSEKVSWQLLLKNKTLKGFKLFIIGSIKKSDYIKSSPKTHRFNKKL